MTGSSTRATLKSELKSEAKRIGFIACGVAKAQRLDEEAIRLEEWLNRGMHGSMSWMENHFEKRIDPARLVDGARTVISVIDTYHQPDFQHPADSGVGRISRYAWGDDYHQVVKKKLFNLFAWLKQRAGAVNGRVFVDSAPVMDKVWAERAGLGWIGKNTNLISRSAGSFFFIGEIIVDLVLDPDERGQDYCGSCTRCVDACPTEALFQPYAIDSNRCISYLTIEHREDDISAELASLFGGWIFGCDICQDVCPWNKFAKPTRDPAFLPRAGVVDTSLQEWIEIDLDEYRKRFRNNPVKRARYDGLKRNIRLALEANDTQSAS
ncbi:MAG: tRNA epoxyqueuosine(34) reductase QueG [Rhodothermia bacterium]|nr:tRNA epoxyqueuosine(34) reductase QueG [Rhodothermia bacterium]